MIPSNADIIIIKNNDFQPSHKPKAPNNLISTIPIPYFFLINLYAFAKKYKKPKPNKKPATEFMVEVKKILFGEIKHLKKPIKNRGKIMTLGSKKNFKSQKNKIIKDIKKKLKKIYSRFIVSK